MSAFEDKEWYPAQVMPGARLGESANKGTLGLFLKFEILSGDMYGQEIEGQFWLTDSEQVKKGTAENLAVVGFNAYSDDWAKVGELIVGKQCEVQAQVQNFKGSPQVRANRLRHTRTGAEKPLPQRAAELFGNVTTVAAVAAGSSEDEGPEGETPF